MFNPEDYIDNIPDFPKKGVIFKDVSPLLRDKFSELLDHMGKMIDWNEIDAIAGIDSRGFILGAALAAKQEKGFIMVRKKGKLPPPVISETYSLEYGEDTLEIKPAVKNDRILILDDVLATGGTLNACLSLCEKAGYQVKGSMVLINLKFLNNFEQEKKVVHSVLSYE